ncbi:hypothetical protein GTU73_04940 [Rathayibacter sp. VKM Ac-2804]|uniref:hypothetical protein n=1 Tax=Rathayibacter sp. VKM Ac-2804 TaxID=2609257 RepID=UPI00132EEF5D|nr:hypothetical protein [Rathayibacter sp. VKM Ac-2804]QHF23418.1 hypothetical protein GTU73_04940 [Rathayibacter sp. VKM Ac-2804]
MTFPLLASSRRSSALSFTALVAVSALLAPAAIAAEDPGPPTLASATVAEALENVERVDPTLLHDAVLEGAGTAALGSGSVVVPSDPSAGVRIGDGARTVIVDLPAAESAGPAAALADGGVVYPAAHSATSVVVGDRGVQMLTTIADAQAPADYSYDVTLAEGQRLELLGDGAAVVDADGGIALLIGAAWAIDADGDRIPTHYSVSGSTLTQTVDHSAPGVAYPVVADPAWLAPFVFKCLIGLGINGPQIVSIMASGGPGSIGGGLAVSIMVCLRGK